MNNENIKKRGKFGTEKSLLILFKTTWNNKHQLLENGTVSI